MSIISNSVQNNGGGASQGIRSQSRTYRSGNSTLHLREGQTLKGVVSDIHGNEITLSMEDGSSFTGTQSELYNQYGESVLFTDNQSYENQWIGGNTYPVIISFMGCTGTFNVTVAPSVIAGLLLTTPLFTNKLTKVSTGKTIRTPFQLLSLFCLPTAEFFPVKQMNGVMLP